ncbi:glycosyltransferase family 4 protein [Rothia nasisuis]|uniref:glycosyltransferase family 4 protein n=1 Tax=Rothia nasisuis TaxID=2109647 RepID=UPI001F46F5A3|nr:glycosyltransferase family 4 protein [Rothia nasisuis]
MKIFLITHYYPPEIGAPQRRWSALVKRWQAAGHQVTVCCPPPHYPDVAATASIRSAFAGTPRIHSGKYGERIIRVPYMQHGVSGLVRTFDQMVAGVATVAVSAAYAVRRQKFDIVVATVPGVPSIGAGLLASKLLRAPLVLEMRDAWPDVVADPGAQVTGLAPLARARRVFARVLTSAQRRADAVVTTTESFARVLKNRGLPRVYTVSNGVTPSLFHSTITPLPHRPGELRILYTGTMGRSQGLTVLCEALEQAISNSPKTRFTVRFVGEGSDRARLQRRVQKKNLPVEFYPLQPRAEVRNHYAWADVTFVSLRNKEAFSWTVPSKIYELLTVPRLLIGLVAGEAAHILDSSGTAVCLRPEATTELATLLIELAHDRSRLEVSQNAKQFVLDHYNYDVLAASYLGLLEQVANNRGPSWEP